GVSPVSGSRRRSFLRFILPAISGTTVTDAQMRLFMVNAPNIARTYNVNLVTATWGEASITWFNQPGVMGTPTTSLSTAGPGMLLYYDVTPDVAGFAAGSPNNGWRVSDANEGSGGMNDVGTFNTTEKAQGGT